MKCNLIYLPDHAGSVEQSSSARESFERNGWTVEMVEGITPKTCPGDHKIMPGGRLAGFSAEDNKKFATKRACVSNHVEFWERVVASGETQAFIEHDAIALSAPQAWEFRDVLILNLEFAFDFGALKGKFKNFKLDALLDSVNELPHNYPLTCKVPNSPYKGSMMIAGTAAYAITPQGATKMLEAVEERGLEQSDYIINDMNVKLEYCNPSPVRFNSRNLRTSHG